MRINTNVSSLVAQEAASNTNKTLANSLEKLSTGLRINKASDDSSGMAIADKLRTQASSIGQGISNANSATAMIQIADKAMSEQSNILDTVKTKLLQASTSTTSAEGREAIRKDVTKLLQQLDNISGQTNYNGINLLKNKGTEFNFQIGEDKSFDVTLKTAYSVTSEGLGATKQVPVDADASLSFGTAAGSVSISQDNTELTVKNTDKSTTNNKAISIGASVTSSAAATDASFKVSAKNVESITLFADTANSSNGVIITTSDAATISVLNGMASATGPLQRSADGSYSLKVTSGASSKAVLDFNGGKLDLNNLTISGLSLGSASSSVESIAIETDSEVSITKLSGGKNLSVDSSTAGTSTATGTLSGVGSTTPSGIAYGSTTGSVGTAALVLKEGTASVKVDQSNSTVTDASIAINSKVFATAASKVADASFQVSANNVSKITLKMTAGQGSIVLSTQDEVTATKLKELSQYNKVLTDLGNGNFQLTATAANANAVLDFGSNKVNLSNLNFAGVQKGQNAGATESIFIQTDEAVTVTKVGNANQPNVSVQGASGLTIGKSFTSVDTNASSITGSLAGLKNLQEGQLTSDVANNYLASVDSALTQLNSVRSDFGSTQNQLDSAIRNMTTTKTNIQAAESLIRDVDYAQESANFNKQNIIAQAGSYAMSQANAVQQNVLKLLQ